MIEIQNYASFVLAVLVFQLTPGPGTIAILNATARHGFRGGRAAVLGTLAGDLVYMGAAVAGLAVVMRAHPLVFQGLQWLGAGYLVWTGIRLLGRRVGGSDDVAAPQRSATDYFRQALAVSLTNPKVILFFMSFFPLFLNPDASALTLGVMMANVTGICLLYQTLLVLLGNRLAQRIRAFPSVARIAPRLAGLALISFGIRLAIDKG